MAVMGLSTAGSTAKAAIPALVSSLNDPDGQVRTMAGQALKSIDPDAAAKAGVK